MLPFSRKQTKTWEIRDLQKGNKLPTNLGRTCRKACKKPIQIATSVTHIQRQENVIADFKSMSVPLASSSTLSGHGWDSLYHQPWTEALTQLDDHNLRAFVLKDHDNLKFANKHQF